MSKKDIRGQAYTAWTKLENNQCQVCGCFLKIEHIPLGESGDYRESVQCNNPRCKGKAQAVA